MSIRVDIYSSFGYLDISSSHLFIILFEEDCDSVSSVVRLILRSGVFELVVLTILVVAFLSDFLVFADLLRSLSIFPPVPFLLSSLEDTVLPFLHIQPNSKYLKQCEIHAT